MGFDLYLAPAASVRGWTTNQWDDFFATDPESFRLGHSFYVALVLESVTFYLEEKNRGSKFPLLMRMTVDETIYWDAIEVPQLLCELKAVREGLAALPYRHLAQEEVESDAMQRRLQEFKQHNPDRPLNTLYDFYFYFIDGFEELAGIAAKQQNGLLIVY